MLSPQKKMNSSSVSTMLENIMTNIQPFWGLIEIFAYLTGFFFVALAIYGLVKVGREGGKAVTVSIVGFITGVLLLSLPAFMDATSQTVFQQNAPGSLSLNAAGGSGDYSDFVNFFLMVVALWGLYSMFRSLVLFRESAYERGHVWSAITHLVGGVVAINFQTFLSVLGVSVGGVFQTMIQHIL